MAAPLGSGPPQPLTVPRLQLDMEDAVDNTPQTTLKGETSCPRTSWEWWTLRAYSISALNSAPDARLPGWVWLGLTPMGVDRGLRKRVLGPGCTAPNLAPVSIPTEVLSVP